MIDRDNEMERLKQREGEREREWEGGGREEIQVDRPTDI